LILHNPIDTAVRDYPIQDPKTKEVALWGIGPGETLDFPDYVGKYLLEVYGFLQEVVTQEQLDVRRKEQEKIAQGKHFTQTKVVGKGAGGFTNEMVQPPAPTADELKPPAAKAVEAAAAGEATPVTPPVEATPAN
jgi:hypothetical protein